MSAKSKILIIIFTLSFLPLFFLSNCNSPMGFGDVIDWEPPVVTLDPGPNPRYIRLGTVIGGTATDNVGVTRVIMRDAKTGEELFQGKLLPDNRFEIILNFTDKDNGKKLSVEVVAYDKMGNTGIASLTIIVDLRSPLVESAWIERSPSKIAWLEPINLIKTELEHDDPLGHKSEHMNRYQNGWFTFTAKLSEDETRIDDVILKIYDYNNFNEPILVPVRESNSTLYAPKWLIKEEDIIQKGVELFGEIYRTNYYTGRQRYYYFASISAFDRSENEGTLQEIVEDQNFFCMWEQADEPKGIIDQIIGNTVYKKMPIPVQLFDDDSLEFAWAGLLTRDQWYGESDIDTGLTIQGGNNDDKLNFLKNRLENGLAVRNWKFDDRYSEEHENEVNLVEEFVKGKNNIDDLTVHIDTGYKDNDYGEFVLFTVVKDKKLDPHKGNGSVDTLRSRWKSRVYEVNIIDDNMPLIVFDTVDTSRINTSSCTGPNDHHCNHLGHDFITDCNTGNSPEENTFPKLRADGKTFEINGYTLRENNSGGNSVQRFRMAWIPNSILGANEKAVIKQVENALRWHLDPLEPLEQIKPENQFPAGVQFWVLDNIGYATSNSYGINGAGILTGTPQELQSTDQSGNTSTTKYIKQVFRKEFNILGDSNDDLKSTYRNFTYNSIRENETKVFVFCAIDSMHKVVFRTIRLLPNRTPPALTVYDITGKNTSGLPAGIPDVFTFDDAGVITSGYMTARKAYNENPATYTALKSVSSGLGDTDRTVSFQSYPRKTQIKYWVNAEKSGDLAIAKIEMQDVTFSADTYVGSEYPLLGSSFNITDRALSYIEYFPEVTSRVFLFTATDTLGNTAQIQRTIAITNAATLTNITTEKLDGKYGIGQIITLKANFDGQIAVNGALNNILLNIRFPSRSTPPPLSGESDYVFRQIPCSRVNTLSLEFDYVVTEGDLGRLETLYDNSSIYYGYTDRNRPISLRNGAQIIDNLRKDQAFTPGNITGFSWTSSTYSLQDPANGKNIQLDGIRPNITGLAVKGKTSITSGGETQYHFKGGETLQFEITSDKDIRVSGSEPVIQYQINGTGTYYNGFVYKNPAGSNKMVFALDINRTNLPADGRIQSFRLSAAAGKIVDDVGNETTSFDFNTMLSTNSNTIIYNDQTPPLAPTVSLTPAPSSPAAPGAFGNSPNTVWYYTTGPQLVINPLPIANEPFTQTREYSLDGGLTWLNFPAPVNLTNSLNNQPWSLQCRIVDIAGNIGPITSQLVHVNSAFPKITSVNVVQPKGIFTSAAGQNTLAFVINFDNPVRVATIGNVTITLTNRNTAANNVNNTGGVNPSYQIQLQADAGQTNNTTSLRFSWTPITAASKEMQDGLFISNINITGLQDQFGNYGGAGTASSTGAGNASDITITPASGGTYTVLNLPAGYIVDSIVPRAEIYNPAVNAVLGGNRTIITIQFNEPMMRGSGTITIKPADDSLIPPVFENDGYYLAADGRHPEPGVLRTYVDGFYDIYNNAALNAADKQFLTESTNAAAPSWGTLRTNSRTGQTVGPYQRLTHGLKAGNGYDGDYANSNQGAKNNYAAGSANGPNPQTGFLVPDTATKWVLDYKLRINDTGNAAITGIANTLKKAKFRWREVDIVNTGVSGNSVTITLNEPLLEGLHWVLSYPAGAFTDAAGNPAAAVTAHEFWTAGVQTPVIRVNRRSYDAREVGTPNLTDLSTQASRGAYPATPPANTAGWNAGTVVTDFNGWGIGDFNTIHYRIESETPGATLTSGTFNDTAANRVTNKSSVTAAFINNVYNANASNQIEDSAWTNPVQTNGRWILSNLIRRGNSVYTVTENGNTVTRTFAGTYNGFRSYNKDATIANLNGVTFSAFNSTVNQGAVTFNALEAGKSYVVAKASVNRTAPAYTAESVIGYEGVFRTIIAILNNGTFLNVGNTRPVIVEGSNIKNGMPSVAGFPVRDAEETGDNRFIKMFYRNANNDNSQLVWISTEIVCEWYFIKYGGRSNTATHMSSGEVNNYLMVGYGDLTYGFNLAAND